MAQPKARGSNAAVLDRPKEPAVVRSIEQQAAEVLRQAREQAARIEREAYDRGYAEGEKDGRLMGERKFEATAQSVRKLAAELSGARQGLLRAAEDEILSLVMQLTRAVVRAEVSANPEVALRAVREALAAMSEDVSALVRLNPADHDYLKGAGLLPEGARYEADPAVSSGGCVAESERERFDARVEREMARLEAALREEMNRGRTNGAA